MSLKPLRKDFFIQPTLDVAQALLGKLLVRAWRGKIIYAAITEVEAYDGLRDKASHAHRGMTKRNAPMFGPAGHWYAYLNYGIHWLVNITAGPEGYPAAVLIRGVEGVSGPGRVGKFFHVSDVLSGKQADKAAGMWIADCGAPPPRMRKTARIGVDYAGLVWAKKLYRFVRA